MNDYNQSLDEEVESAAELGQIVFESAVLKYLAQIDDAKAEEFGKFIDSHGAKEDFIELLGNEFPDFALILKEEVELIQAEIDGLVTED